MSAADVSPNPDYGAREKLVQFGCFAADHVALDPANTGITPAEMTRREIAAALDLLLGNGLITVVDPDAWPEMVKLDPPYDASPSDGSGASS